MLDTLGISLVTPPMKIAANEVTHTVIAVPSPATFSSICSVPPRGARWDRARSWDGFASPTATRPPSARACRSSGTIPIRRGFPPTCASRKKPPRVREATVGADGTYRLCGLPEKYEGKLQAQRKDGGATAEVPVVQDGGLLALRSMSVAALAAHREPGRRRARPSAARGHGARVRARS